MDDDRYLAELLAEKERLDPSLIHCSRMLSREIESVKAGSKSNSVVSIVGADQTQVHLAEKVFVPAKDFPGYNFVGRLLGPRGLTLKRMQSESACRMTIMGRGSIKDASKEEEKRTSGDPKFEHLKEDLHVLIEAKGAANVATARMAAGVAQVRTMLIPGDGNDQLRNEQLRELALLNGLQEHNEALEAVKKSDSDSFRPRHHVPAGRIMARNISSSGMASGSQASSVYAQASSGAEFAPVMMVPAPYQRVAYAKPAMFESSFVDPAMLTNRGFGEFMPPDAQVQMVHMPMGRSAIGNSSVTAVDPWGKPVGSRAGKRYHPYTTAAEHY